MKPVSSSDLKAKLAKYLRLVRNGETIEVRDRGIPIAILRGTEKESTLPTIPPSDEPAQIGRLVSEVRKVPTTDVVQLLLDDRHKR